MNSTVTMIQSTAFPFTIASSSPCLWRYSAPADVLAPWQCPSQPVQPWSRFPGFPLTFPSDRYSASTSPSDQLPTFAPL